MREGGSRGQVLRGRAATTRAVRAAIQRSTASTAALGRKYGVNPKTIAKWRGRQSVDDAPMG
ncbi:MAG: IS481 family transposase, partial [Pseudomonadota bacterium]